jgi:hypothetical protein
VLLVAHEQAEVEFASASGWSLERVSLGDAAAKPVAMAG